VEIDCAVGSNSRDNSSGVREELARLRRENHRLRQERDILAKAAAWFARESKASPTGFTGS
jgi:transposase